LQEVYNTITLGDAMTKALLQLHNKALVPHNCRHVFARLSCAVNAGLIMHVSLLYINNSITYSKN